MTGQQLDFAYVNYAHGGSLSPSWSGSRGPYQFEGLVRLLGDGGRWPDVAVMGEAEQYEYAGGEGLWGAASALADASGRAYIPVLGTLPREWGPIGPCMFVDGQKVRIRRFYSGREPDFYSRNRNLLVASVAGREDVFRIVSGHGDLNDPGLRLHDAMGLRKYADPATPAAVLMDWNSTPSGPHEVTDFSMYTHRWQYAPRLHWSHGPDQGSEPSERSDTQARDYLCGWWNPRTCQRQGGLGFFDVAELAGLHAPTTLPRPNGRPPTAIDAALVNAAWKDAVVLDSVRVHEPADPERPDSDHLRVSFAVQV